MRDPRDDGRGAFQGTAAGLCIGIGAWSLGRSLRDVRPANSYTCLPVVCCEVIQHEPVHCLPCQGVICTSETKHYTCMLRMIVLTAPSKLLQANPARPPATASQLI